MLAGLPYAVTGETGCQDYREEKNECPRFAGKAAKPVLEKHDACPPHQTLAPNATSVAGGGVVAIGIQFRHLAWTEGPSCTVEPESRGRRSGWTATVGSVATAFRAETVVCVLAASTQCC